MSDGACGRNAMEVEEVRKRNGDKGDDHEHHAHCLADAAMTDAFAIATQILHLVFGRTLAPITTKKPEKN